MEGISEAEASGSAGAGVADDRDDVEGDSLRVALTIPVAGMRFNRKSRNVGSSCVCGVSGTICGLYIVRTILHRTNEPASV